jgi:hypothetical protein
MPGRVQACARAGRFLQPSLSPLCHGLPHPFLSAWRGTHPETRTLARTQAQPHGMATYACSPWSPEVAHPLAGPTPWRAPTARRGTTARRAPWRAACAATPGRTEVRGRERHHLRQPVNAPRRWWPHRTCATVLCTVVHAFGAVINPGRTTPPLTWTTGATPPPARVRTHLKTYFLTQHVLVGTRARKKGLQALNLDPPRPAPPRRQDLLRHVRLRL